MRALPALVAGLAAAVATAAQAAPAGITGDTQTYLESAANQSAMKASLEEAAQSLVPGCKTLSADGAKTVVYKPISFTPKGEPSGGMFRETATVDACGTRLRINVLAIARPDGPIKRITLLPGTTIGDPMLQRDALRYAFGGAQGAVPKDCRALGIRNTEFLRYDPKNLEGKKPWREVWTVSACDKLIPVEMIFQPDADGTTVIARPHTH